jgi:hypothetical protein
MRNPDANLGKQSFILEFLPPEALVAPTLIARDCHTDWTRFGCGSSLNAKQRIVSSALSKDEFPTPSEFMRGRRPEQFSDSRVEENIELDAGFLEYKLESITSRGAHSILGCEISPILLENKENEYGPHRAGSARTPRD